MGRVFAFVNMKGGVGKTTASVLFAETLARYEKRVLFVDLDAQASASFAIAGFETLRSANREKTNICGFLSNAIALGTPPRMDRFRIAGASNLRECHSLDLIASHPELRIIEREFFRSALRSLNPFANPERTFQKVRRPIFGEIRRLSAEYDYVVVDCPPGVSLFVEAGVFAADVVICPTAPEALATLGLETIVARFYQQDWFINELVDLKRPIPAFRILFSRVDAGSERHRREIDEVETKLEKQAWIESNIAIVDEEIETAPALARAFDDPDLEQSYDDRYRDFARRAADITNAIIESAGS